MDLARSISSNTVHIGRYLLEDLLGEGASGRVYRAYDPVMDRDVAIKSAKVDTLTAEQVKQVIRDFHHEAHPFDWDRYTLVGAGGCSASGRPGRNPGD